MGCQQPNYSLDGFKNSEFIMNNHNRNKSVTNIITELNLHSTELRYKGKKVQLMHYMLTQKTFLSTC